MAGRNESFPSVGQTAALLVAGFLLQYVIGAALFDARRVLGLEPNQLNALVMLLANGVLVALVMHYRDMTYGDLFHPAKSSALATLLLVVPAVMLLVPAILLANESVNALLEHLLPLSLWEEQAFANMVAGNLAAVISTCVLAPLLEEMLFRGIILRAFLLRHERWAAISYSALFFGAAHLNIYQFVMAFWLGLLLGWLFERSRSLIPCIALHAAVNSCVVWSEASRKSGADQGFVQNSPLVWFLACSAAVLGVVLLRRLLSSRRPFESTNAA
jgi:membrane protease YdiL (CAAX protease family)